MTMANLEAQQAARRAAGRASRASKCPGCGEKLPPSTGKRARQFCGEACRSKARRKATAFEGSSGTQNRRSEAGSTPATTGERFSTKGKIPSTAGQRGSEAETTPKRTPSVGGGWEGRFERREAHQTVALGKGFCRCGTRLVGGSAAVLVGERSATFAGVQTCHSVHMCTVCGSKILTVRAANAQAMADALAAAGYGLYLGTHTLRHFERMRYGTLKGDGRGGLVVVLHEGWKGAFGSAGRPWRRLAAEFGIVGYERAFEDTWGSDTGHHLHWHVLWVTTRPLSEDDLARFRRRLAETWRDSVLGAGGYEVSTTCSRPGCACRGEGHGTDLRPLNSGEEGDAARYLYKDGDKGPAGFGLEFTRSDLKDGRRWGRMSAFQLADLAAEELAELGKPGPLTLACRERENGVHGVRKHYRSQSLNKILKALEVAQDERTDAEIAADEEDDRRLVAVIPSATWYQHVVRQRGRRLALLRAAQSLGEVGVRTLIESWGLVWGTDVLPAESAQE
jgi:hypothetical protein